MIPRFHNKVWVVKCNVVRRYAEGLYKGLTPTLGADIVGNGLGFFIYDTCVDKYKQITGKKAGSIERGMFGGAVHVTRSTRLTSRA